ncbi:MAG: type II toxin-antitoxin system RelE/ParE family toxin [Candidatus Omnitrophica bacterium]|nr:type II toxin-antitoxin system RelE/ParE family toxin [Candidatus Omnitrophota bacterium]
MQKVVCYYYPTSSNRALAKEFIDSLDFKTQRKFFFVKGLLEEFGRDLPMPHAKYIGDDIFELRFKGIEGAIRVLYFFYHVGKVIFTNGFVKKSDKTPAREKELAAERRKRFLNENIGGGKS